MNKYKITFYRANEKPYGVLSNLYRCRIMFEGLEFPSAEHAYQYGKPRKPELAEWLMSPVLTPRHVAIFAHALQTWDISPGWSRDRYLRMRLVLHAKFSQNERLAKVLLSTGDAELVETGTVDNAVNRRWGRVNGNGQNQLGFLLMETRTRLRKIKEADEAIERMRWEACGT